MVGVRTALDAMMPPHPLPRHPADAARKTPLACEPHHGAIGGTRHDGFMRTWLKTSLVALSAALGATGAVGQPSVQPEPTDQRLAFDVADGANLNSFLQVGPVAAHLVLRAGTEPRIIVAFPAGDSGVGIWFSPTPAPVAWTLDERPQPITRNDAKGRPLHGVEFQATVIAGPTATAPAATTANAAGAARAARAAAPMLSIGQVLLSSVRVLRDYQTLGKIPPEVNTAPHRQRQTLLWQRDRLDGAAGYRLSLEVTHGHLKGGRITAGRDGRIGMTLSALSGEQPLTPLPARELFADAAPADPAARNALAFLSYQEKFLAGSWRYDTYFGRDTLMALRLLLPALSPAAVEDGLGSVLARLSSTGEVAHEEDVGEFALLDHLHTGTRSDAPVFDYKMIDGAFMLAPVAETWLLADARASSRAAAFLSRQDGGYGRPPRSFGADLVTNLRFVIQSARAFAAQPKAAHLIGLKKGNPWGQWRDSDEGLARGRYPYDVNAIFVPAALGAASRLFASGLLTPYLSDDDRTVLAEAAEMADVWRARAGAYFEVDVPNAAAHSQIETYARSAGVSPDAALRSIGTYPVRFHALALDGDARPIAIMNSDEGFDLLLGNPSVQSLDTAIASVMRPFPAGLMTEVGMVVANPVFATPALQARFGNTAYHGTVIWSWQQAVLAAGLARQLARRDLPDPLQQRLRAAQEQLWRVIEAGRPVINSELWSWSYRNGHYVIAPFGIGSTDSNESNAAQLWSTVYLGVRAPAL